MVNATWHGMVLSTLIPCYNVGKIETWQSNVTTTCNPHYDFGTLKKMKNNSIAIFIFTY